MATKSREHSPWASNMCRIFYSDIEKACKYCLRCELFRDYSCQGSPEPVERWSEQGSHFSFLFPLNILALELWGLNEKNISMFYFNGNLHTVLKDKLKEFGINNEHILFILSQIYSSDADSYFWFTPYDIDKRLKEFNPILVEIFHKASQQCNIHWEKTNKEDETSYIFIAKTNQG